MTRKARRAALVAAVAGPLLLTGCQHPASATHAGSPATGAGVVLVVSGTRSEPSPTLPPTVVDALETTADATEGDASAVVVSADGTARTVLPLTPHRADGSVEHGLQRPRLVAQNVAAVEDAAAGVTAKKDGLDLLEGISTGVRGARPGLLVVVSNGLSTSGGLDLRQVGWNADPATVATQLRERGVLEDLRGWHVVFTGLGDAAGDQPPLPKPARDTLTAYWTAICTASGAASCAVDATPAHGAAPRGTATVPVVPIPGLSSVVGPHGEVTTTITDELLGFRGDSAEVSPAGRALLGQVAGQIRATLAAHPDAPVVVHGYTADPPGYSPDRLARLARARSEAVVAVLVAAGVPTTNLHAVGDGPAPGMTAVVDGHFDEFLGARMRRVEITH
jgi:outer membrane protein OmpA-like peptidoglycan-associated protein